MLRGLLVMVALVGVASADRIGPSPLASAACVSSVPADLDGKRAAAEKARDDAFTRALEKKKLTPWSGVLDVYPIEERYGPPQKHARKPGTGKNTIQLGSWVYGNAPPVEWVADKSGTVYRLQRAPIGGGQTILLCGCPPITHGGTAILMVRWAAELPEKTKFGGDVSIEYIDRVPTTSYQRSNCPQPP